MNIKKAIIIGASSGAVGRVVVVDSGTKKVSSTIGHKLMDDHIFKKERISQSHLNFSKLKKSIDSNDLDSFIEVVENEALTLHALMMTSNPNFILFNLSAIKSKISLNSFNYLY